MSSPYIISASRREDIPGHSNRIKWFLERLQEGKFSLQGFYQNYDVTLEKLKLIVFWTKNPQPLLEHLDEIPYEYYFQFSLNHYPEYELNVPSLDKRIQTFKDLSNKIGKEKVIWRFDPIIVNQYVTTEILLKRIEYIGNQLYPYTEKLVFSFIDPYKKLGNLFTEIDIDTKLKIAEELIKFNQNWNLKLATCAEGIELEGIEHNKCIDPELVKRICGEQKWISETKDKNQRLDCGCMTSSDIGSFKQCKHKCSYCLDENTLILMGDSTYKKIKDIIIGDEIYGVEANEKYHKYIKSIVTNKWGTFDKSYKITLSNGLELICSANHRWLTQRGWRHTFNKLKINNITSSVLTTNSKLSGMGQTYNTEFIENLSYKKGYLCAAMLGDGTIGTYDYSGRRRAVDIQNKFRFVVKDNDIMNRFKKYMADVGIDYFDMKFSMIDRKTKQKIISSGIRSSSLTNYNKMIDIINDKFNENDDFMKGFIAGIYDAEGTTGRAKRIFNSDLSIIQIIEKILTKFNIKYTFDKDIKSKNKIVKTIRIPGGINEHLRFYNIFRPTKNKFNFFGYSIKSFEDLHVTNIELYKENQKLIDITTTTGNFIANGVVSHNCYAQ